VSKTQEINLKLSEAKLPAHVAIIMDGNGRWAKAKGLPRLFGHKAGVKTVKKIVECSRALNIKVLTLYAFSTENWKRPETEITALLTLLKRYIKSEADDLKANNIRLKFIGDLKKFSSDIQKKIAGIESYTDVADVKMTLLVALNYGARAEILHAFEKLAAGGARKITEKDISNNLYTAGYPDPDLLIRTSGEMRLSNFLLWQIAYAEIYITKKLWPDFNEKDFKEAIADYQKRARRYGGL
jgi:undecaprenyl diphosphate synthase